MMRFRPSIAPINFPTLSGSSTCYATELPIKIHYQLNQLFLILIFVLGIIQQHVGPRLMLQGVQDTYDTYPMTKSSPGEEKSILVLIGKNLDGQLLQSDFDRIINEDTNAF